MSSDIKRPGVGPTLGNTASKQTAKAGPQKAVSLQSDGLNKALNSAGAGPSKDKFKIDNGKLPPPEAEADSELAGNIASVSSKMVSKEEEGENAGKFVLSLTSEALT